MEPYLNNTNNLSDSEKNPLSRKKHKSLTKKNNTSKINKYKFMFFISVLLHIINFITIISLLFQIDSQKKEFKIKLESFSNQNNYYKKEYKDNDTLIEKNNETKENDFNNENEKPILNIDKNELLEMCYKSREYYFYERRKKQNGYYPVSRYIDPKTETIQSKINYLIIHESPEYKSKIVDKIKLREYASKILGKDICVPIIKIYNNISEINFDELPDKFVLKCNHGAGMNVIVPDKSKLNYEEAKNNLDSWMKRNFGLEGAEFQYINVEKKIFAETFLKDEIEDYKIYCFHGVPKLIRVQKFNKVKNLKINNYFTLNWTLTDIETGRPGFYRDPNVFFRKPQNLDLILSYARQLSQEFVFVRIDFYEVNGKVYLGEMTFSPSNVCFTLKNMEQAKYLGSFIDVSKIRKYLVS